MAAAADDEPSITRWSFEDFERYYDVGLGIRHQPKGDGDDDDDDEEDAPPGSGPADSARANGGADLAVFEQYERLDRNVEFRNGAMEAGPPNTQLSRDIVEEEERHGRTTMTWFSATDGTAATRSARFHTPELRSCHAIGMGGAGPSLASPGSALSPALDAGLVHPTPGGLVHRVKQL